MRRYSVFIISLLFFFASLSVIEPLFKAAVSMSQPFPSSILQSQNDPEVVWWNLTWNFRTPFDLYSGEYDRVDAPFERAINFTSLLAEFGVQGTLDQNSVRVIEYDSAGNILEEVPSQFDKASNFDAISNAIGNVVWIMEGITPAHTMRYYQVYFDILENGSKSPPNYAGVSSRISGNYVLLENEKINVTIRYMKGISIEEIYLDKNGNGVFELDEELIGKDYPNIYRLVVGVTDAEKQKHPWSDFYFEYFWDDEASLEMLKDGPILKEIRLYNVSLRNSFNEALNITAEIVVKLYKFSTTLSVKTLMTVNEDLGVSISYEYDFLDHMDLYDKWYVDEDQNGKFTYGWWGTLPYGWFFSGIPTHGFLSVYNSSGKGGIGFIPKMSGYSHVDLGEYRDAGPAVRFHLPAGTWAAGKKIELENKLFAHVGDWTKVEQEERNINKPVVAVTNLRIHLVDSNNSDVHGGEVKIYGSTGNAIYTSLSNSTGWAAFTKVPIGDVTVKVFWMGLPVGEKRVNFIKEAIIDPFILSVFSLTVHTFSAEGNPMSDVKVGLYVNGTRISSLETEQGGFVLFKQLPLGDYVVKTYRAEQQFGSVKSIRLSSNIEASIYEAPPSEAPKANILGFSQSIMYGAIIAGLGLMTTIVVRRRYSRAKLAIFLSILILVSFLLASYVQSKGNPGSSPSGGISFVFREDTGFVTISDIIGVRWKDLDRNGVLDDWNFYIVAWNGTEIAKIDLRTSLVTPVGIYSLYEAKTKNIFYLDTARNNYNLFKPLFSEPDFTNSIGYQRSLTLKFAFIEPDKWEVDLFLTLEEGKPYIQLRWEINEKGEGAGDYSLYPQIVPVLPFDRLVLPADYTLSKLSYWNQKNGPLYGNPWAIESGLNEFGGFVGNMYVNDENVYLHSGANYEVQTNLHTGAAFARQLSNWVEGENETVSYFQYDFWVDWRGKVLPSSDIKVEVWVPDVLDLARSEISYSPDGESWVKYGGWTLTEGNRGDPGFSSYGGTRHRLLITFPAYGFTPFDGPRTGSDYGDPYAPTIGHYQYLIRLRVAYRSEGLVTYEFEDTLNKWYGLQNMNDAWMWLVNSQRPSLSVGIVPTKSLSYLASQANRPGYRNITIGITEQLTNNGNASFLTNMVMFVENDLSMRDDDSNGILNMFENNLPKFFVHSAVSASRESLARIRYERLEFDQEAKIYRWVLEKEPLLNNSWNAAPAFTATLPREIEQHVESDDAMFRFERHGYYVYDVSQSNEIAWKEKADISLTSQLYAIIGLAILGSVLFIKSRDTVKKYRVILLLFLIGFGVRMYFQSLSVDFVGSDAAVYSNIAENVLIHGKFQMNALGVEPQWAKAEALPSVVTHTYTDVTRYFWPGLIATMFALLGKSFFAVKSVDVLLGSLIIIPTYFLAKKLFGEKTAIVASLIVIFHPLLIIYSGPAPSTNIEPALFATVALCLMLYESKKAAVAAGLTTVLLLLARFEYAFILIVSVGLYYILFYRWNFWRKKNLYIIGVIFSAAVILVLFWYNSMYGMLPISTKLLGGTLGELRAPTLLETLLDPIFLRVRLYNVSYAWWYVLYQSSPILFLTALLGLLMYIKRWREVSALYLFPLVGISVYSLAIRANPHTRWVVEYVPLLAILSAAFIVGLSKALLPIKPRASKRQFDIGLKQTLLVFVFVEIIFLSFFSQHLTISVAMRNSAVKFNYEEIVYNWVRVNTQPNSIIMVGSSVFVYYVERETVIGPYQLGKVKPDMNDFLYVIRQLRVDYVVLDRSVFDMSIDMVKIRRNPLSAPFGFQLVYWLEDPFGFDPRVLIYDVRTLHE